MPFKFIGVALRLLRKYATVRRSLRCMLCQLVLLCGSGSLQAYTLCWFCATAHELAHILTLQRTSVLCK